MSTSLLNIFQPTINTRDRLSPTITNFNVFQGMSQRAAASITNSHISLHFDWWDLLDEFEGVGSVFTQFVLNIQSKKNCHQRKKLNEYNKMSYRSIKKIGTKRDITCAHRHPENTPFTTGDGKSHHNNLSTNSPGSQFFLTDLTICQSHPWQTVVPLESQKKVPDMMTQ